MILRDFEGHIFLFERAGKIHIVVTDTEQYIEIVSSRSEAMSASNVGFRRCERTSIPFESRVFEGHFPVLYDPQNMLDRYCDFYRLIVIFYNRIERSSFRNRRVVGHFSD